jgi:hypothetical protein
MLVTALAGLGWGALLILVLALCRMGPGPDGGGRPTLADVARLDAFRARRGARAGGTIRSA